MPEDEVTPVGGEGQVEGTPEGATPETPEPPVGQGEPETPEQKSYREIQAYSTRISQENADLRRRMEALEAKQTSASPADDDLPPEYQGADDEAKKAYRRATGLMEKIVEKRLAPLVINQAIREFQAKPGFKENEQAIKDVVLRLAGAVMTPEEKLDLAYRTVVPVAGKPPVDKVKILKQKEQAGSLEKAGTRGGLPIDLPKNDREAAREAWKRAGEESA